MFEYLTAFGTLTAGFYAVFERRYRQRALGAFAMHLSLLLLLLAQGLFSLRIQPLLPALQNNRLLAIYVAAMVISYSALTVGFAATALYLMQGDVNRYARLPKAQVLETLTYRAVLVGFPVLALGIRHGIDWDHIAAITDITSTSATVVQTPAEAWLTAEPDVQLTDERHHGLATAPVVEAASSRLTQPARQPATVVAGGGTLAVLRRSGWQQFVVHQRRPLFLGTVYALGHGTMVIGLGLLAILFAQILPDWVDPMMERIVGATLLFLGLYLFYSLYRFFRSGEEFRIRSRWMLVFAAVGNTYHRLTHRLHGDHGDHDHHHVDPGQQYGVRTAYAIGLIHGIGAETGTQVLIIGTAASGFMSWLGRLLPSSA